MPTSAEVESIFSHLASRDNSGFFDNVIDDVDWTIQGHSPMSGHYKSKSEFLAATLSVLGKDVLTEPLRMGVKNVVSGDGQAAVELAAIDAWCKNGKAIYPDHHDRDMYWSNFLGLKYDMTYCWVVKFNQQNKIYQVRAYIDTDLLIRAMEHKKAA